MQLWKLMGLEECVPQCRDPLPMQLKEKALFERETLLAEVQAAESQHQARHAAQQHVWALVARIEMMARLKAASIEVGGQGQA